MGSVSLDFYTMKIEAEESGPSQLSGLEGIPVYRGSGFEGFHCTAVNRITWISHYISLDIGSNSRSCSSTCILTHCLTGSY